MKELKILFAGLANAGKTSILKVLDDDFEKIADLVPTLGVSYNAYKMLGLDVTAWDLGGQITYRDKYLKDYASYFSDTLVLFYVIDIQDEATFEESVKYLKDIVEIFQKLGLKDVYFVILLHKFEIHVQNKEMRTTISSLQARLATILSKISSVFYETTIYEPYTIFHAISNGILHQMSGREVLHQKLKGMAEQLGVPAVMLSSRNGYPFGIWYSIKVEILELVKFFRSLFNSKSLILKTDDFLQLQGSENFGTLALIFRYQAELILFSLLVPKDADLESLRLALPRKINELQKLMMLLQV